jgi:hypothetical protein
MAASLITEGITSTPSILSPAAERMRRYRQRQRDKFRCLTVELHETEIEALIQKGLLAREMRNDTLAIIEALYAYFDRTLVVNP